MIYDRILVRYGELSIKGKNRKYFKNALHKIIRRKLRGLENLTYEVTRDRSILFKWNSTRISDRAIR